MSTFDTFRQIVPDSNVDAKCAVPIFNQILPLFSDKKPEFPTDSPVFASAIPLIHTMGASKIPSISSTDLAVCKISLGTISFFAQSLKGKNIYTYSEDERKVISVFITIFSSIVKAFAPLFTDQNAFNSYISFFQQFASLYISPQQEQQVEEQFVNQTITVCTMLINFLSECTTPPKLNQTVSQLLQLITDFLMAIQVFGFIESLSLSLTYFNSIDNAVFQVFTEVITGKDASASQNLNIIQNSLKNLPAVLADQPYGRIRIDAVQAVLTYLEELVDKFSVSLYNLPQGDPLIVFEFASTLQQVLAALIGPGIDSNVVQQLSDSLMSRTADPILRYICSASANSNDKIGYISLIGSLLPFDCIKQIQHFSEFLRIIMSYAKSNSLPDFISKVNSLDDVRVALAWAICLAQIAKSTVAIACTSSTDSSLSDHFAKVTKPPTIDFEDGIDSAKAIAKSVGNSQDVFNAINSLEDIKGRADKSNMKQTIKLITDSLKSSIEGNSGDALILSSALVLIIDAYGTNNHSDLRNIAISFVRAGDLDRPLCASLLVSSIQNIAEAPAPLQMEDLLATLKSTSASQQMLSIDDLLQPPAPAQNTAPKSHARNFVGLLKSRNTAAASDPLEKERKERNNDGEKKGKKDSNDDDKAKKKEQRCVRQVEASREVEKLLHQVSVGLGGGGLPERIEKAIDALRESLEGTNDSSTEEIVRRIDAARALALAAGALEGGPQASEAAAAFADVTAAIIDRWMAALGLSSGAQAELILMTSRIDALESQIGSDEPEDGGETGLRGLVASEARVLLRMTRRIGKSAQAQTKYLGRARRGISNEGVLINAAQQTSDAAQMFFLLLKMTDRNDAEMPFKVVAAVKAMRAALASLIVNIESKGGSEEITREMKEVSEMMFVRLRMIAEKAEAEMDQNALVAVPRGKSGISAIVQKRNASTVVFQKRRELEEAEEALKRFNRSVAKRKH